MPAGARCAWSKSELALYIMPEARLSHRLILLLELAGDRVLCEQATYLSRCRLVCLRLQLHAVGAAAALLEHLEQAVQPSILRVSAGSAGKCHSCFLPHSVATQRFRCLSNAWCARHAAGQTQRLGWQWWQLPWLRLASFCSTKKALLPA